MNAVPPFFSESVLPWLGKTMKLVDSYFGAFMAEKGFDVSRRQWLVIMIIHSNGPQPQNNLALITERDKASLKRLIDTMERKNFVARLPVPDDKRVNLIHLTKQGISLAEKTKPIMQGLIDELQEGTSKEDREAAIRVMGQIQENIIKKL
ncbi:MAG: DNA-binding MarR family transcriptional regulator [Sphingobacteriales bacterium]|jgi:DNA-binding MarR family transcriptional regulator